MKLRELAAAVAGEVLGSGEVEITEVAEIEHASPGAIVMVRDTRDLPRAEASQASALLLPDIVAASRKPAIRARNLRLAFARTIALLHPGAPFPTGIHPTAVVGPGTRMGKGVTLGPYTVIGEGCTIEDGVVILASSVIGREVTVGQGSILYPRVTVYDRTVIGRRVMLHSGAVIGSDGFGYATEDDRQVKIPHIGRVVIEDDVEIGANTTVDRATLGETRIGAGTKIDNLVQIGHNVWIGPHTVIVAQVGVAGSVTVGAGVVLGGQAGLVDHISIGDRATVLARSMVSKSIPPDAVVSGSPARIHREELKMQAAHHRVLELLARVDALEQAVLKPTSGGQGREVSRPRRRGSRRTGGAHRS